MKEKLQKKILFPIYSVFRIWPLEPPLNFLACSDLFLVKLEFPPGAQPALDIYRHQYLGTWVNFL